MNWNWKKIILWTVLAIFILVVGIGVTAVLLVQHSTGFRGYLLTKIESSVKESTGATLQVRDFRLRLSTLTLDVYGIVVHGTEPASAPPLMQADHLSVGVTIDSLLRRKFHFRDVELNHPVVSVRVNQAGQNNLPKPEKKSTSSSNTGLFDLGIRQLMLDRGEVYYNDQKTPLSASLRNLELTAGYDPGPRRYQGHLQYEDGKIQYGHYAPLPHNLDAGFALTPQRFVLDRMALGLGQSQVILNATVDDYSNNPNVQGNYQASLVTGEFARVLRNPSLPVGTVHLTGTVQYQAQPNQPALNSAVVRGMLSSPELYVKTPSLRTAIRNVSAKYQLEHGNATVENMRAELLGGRFDGKLTLLNVAGNGQGRLQASLKDVSLDVLQKMAQAQSLREAHLVGNLNADARASWVKSIANLTATANATLRAAIGQNPSTPLDGVIHADYSAARQEVALHQSYIKTPKTSINLDGKVSELSQLQIRMHSDDLHEIETVAANFKTASASAPPEKLDLYGVADFNGSVSGSTKNPEIQGQFTASNLRVKGSSWRLVRTNIHASPSQAMLSNGELLSATQGRFTFNVQTGLKNWAYTPNSPIAVQLNASQVSIADLERLANKTYPVSGTLAMNVSLHGSQQNPVGNGTVTVTNAKVSNETVQSLNLNFNGDGNAVNTRLQIKMPAGTTQATGVIYPKTQGYELKVTGNNIRLEKLQAVAAKNLQIAGPININAQGKGTLKNPQLTATLDIPQLQVQKQTIQGIKFQTTVQNHVANFALDSAVAQTYVKGRGTVGISAPYRADVKLDTGRIAFAPLLALYAPAQAANMGGETELHVSLRGPLAEKNRVEAHLEIPVLAANYKQVKLAAAQPIRLDYQNGTAVLQPTSIQGTGTDIRMQGSVPVNNLKAASFLVKGTVDVGIAQMIQPDLISKGQIQFDIDSRRYAAGSNLNGQLRIVNASFHTPASPVGLDNANGVINVTRERLQIASFQGEVGGGTVTARGGVAYSPAVQFDLAMSAKEIRLRYPEGLRTIIDSNLAYTGNMQASTVTGTVTVAHISLTPEFDLSTFTDQFSSGGSGGAPSSPFEQSVKLNIAVQSSSQMELASSQVSIQGNANLRITGTAAQPVILGRTTLAGGELFLAGNRYVIQQGTIEFLNPVRTEPIVNLQVRTTINEYNISLNIQGPVERLHTNFTSDPALPPVDIINLIARGQTTEAAAAAQSQPLALGAQSALASAVSSQVSSRIAKVAGISHLSVDPALGGSGQDPGARISIQQRVTSNIYVTFATDVTSTQRQAIELEYRLNRRWSLQGVRDQNGGFGVDAHYTKEY